MLNAGNGNFFRRGGYTSNFYDVQARSLLHGHWDMPGSVLALEGIESHGKHFMYFGPFPALLRLPFVAFGSSLDGRLTQLSMLAAFAVALFGASRLLWRARQLLRAGAPFGRWEALITGGWIFFVGVGSAMLFPASQLLVYHEAELWGTALALVGLDAVIGLALRSSWWRVVGAAILATAAITTRPSVGLGPALALGALAGLMLVTPWWSAQVGQPWPARLRARLPLALPPAGAALVPVAIYALINRAKFGSLFNVPLNHQFESTFDAHRQAVLRANGGSLFNIQYVPTTVVHYLRPDALRIWHLFPFVDFTTWKAHIFLGTRFDVVDQSSSLPATMPAFVALAVTAAAVVLWRRRASRPVLQSVLPVVVGAALAVVPTLVIGYVANRYLIDFLPLLLIPATFGGQFLLRQHSATAPRRRRAAHRRHDGQRRRRVAVVGGLAVVLFAFGAWANVALALSYQRLTWGPVPARASYIDLQEGVAATLGTAGYPVRQYAALPRRAATSQLAVTGACDAVYWGDANHRWQPVEQGPAATAVRARVRVNPGAASVGAALPLVRVGTGLGAYLVTMQVRPSGQATLAIGGTGHTPPGPNVPVPLGRPFLVEAVFDHQLRIATIRLDGRDALFAPNQTFPPGSPVFVVGGPAPSRLVDAAHLERVPTPICGRFRSDGRFRAAPPG